MAPLLASPPQERWRSTRSRRYGEGGAEVRQRERNGPGAADRTRHDLVGTGWLEGDADGHGVRVPLERPEARPHFGQEVDPLRLVHRGRRGAVARETTQGRRV